MEVQSLVAAPAKQALHERLRGLKPGEEEMHIAFLGRATSILSEHSGHVLTDEDLAIAVKILPEWLFMRSARIQSKDWGTARRIGWAIASVRETLSDYRVPGRRIVGVESNNIFLLARPALEVADLEAVIEIEQASTNPSMPATLSRRSTPLAELIG